MLSDADLADTDADAEPSRKRAKRAAPRPRKPRQRKLQERVPQEAREEVAKALGLNAAGEYSSRGRLRVANKKYANE